MTGRHAARKPARRVTVTMVKRAVLVFLAAFFAGALFPQLGAAAAHAATAARAGIADTAGNAAACSAAEWFRHVDRSPLYQDAALWHSAYAQADASAAHASPALRHAIRRYLYTDRGYRRVVDDCQQVGYGQ